MGFAEILTPRTAEAFCIHLALKYERSDTGGTLRSFVPRFCLAKEAPALRNRNSSPYQEKMFA